MRLSLLYHGGKIGETTDEGHPAMATTTARKRAPKPPLPPKPPAWTCQFCKSGLCGSCPGMIVAPFGEQPAIPWFCECGRTHRKPYCRDCRNENPDEISPETWRCLDNNVCAGRLALRLQHDRLWRMIQACRAESVAAARRRKQMAIAIDPEIDEAIEREHDWREEAKAAQRARTKAASKAVPRPKPPPRPTSGVCECGCGGATKGGKFQPGHDAKLASRLKDRVMNGSAEEAAAAYEEMERRRWLSKLNKGAKP